MWTRTRVLLHLAEEPGGMGPFGGDLVVVSQKEIVDFVHSVRLKHGCSVKK